MLPLTAYAEQHTALGVAEGVGQEVLQDAPQQFDIAVDPQAAAAQAEVHAVFGSQHPELCTQGVEQIVQHKGMTVRSDAAVFQARDIQQVADQVLGRAQRAVQMAHQFTGIDGQGVVLMGQCGGEQPRSIQWLHQIMADGGQKAGFRLVGGFGYALGFGQRLVQL